MSKQKAFGNTRNGNQITFSRYGSEVNKQPIASLNELAEKIFDEVKLVLDMCDSNTKLDRAISVFKFSKVKGEDRKQKMKTILYVHAEQLHDEVKKKLERYFKKPKILLLRDIKNAINRINIIRDLLLGGKFIEKS